MSAAKMVADSTQGDSATDGKKRKKKIKKSAATKNKIVLPEDEDSDLDLKKELHPIGFYLKDRSAMIEEMFHSVRGASLQRALPELLKSMPLEELKDLCLEQLEVMSKKRIQRILAGEESANISSSGTEDMDDDEEDVDTSDEDLNGGGVKAAAGDSGVSQASVNTSNIEKREVGDGEEGPELAADSTSAVMNSDEHRKTDLSDHSEKQLESNSNDKDNSKDDNSRVEVEAPPPIEQVYIKQEPPDSEPEHGHERNYRRRHKSSDSSDRSRSYSRSRSRGSSSSRSSYRRRRRRRHRRRSRSSRSSSSSTSSSRSRSGRSSESEKASLIEGGYEEPPEAYTSGSEDGELVRKEVVVPSVKVKQEVVSDPEDKTGDDGVIESKVAVDKTLIAADSDISVNDGMAIASVKEMEGDLLASVAGTGLGSDDGNDKSKDDGGKSGAEEGSAAAAATADVSDDGGGGGGEGGSGGDATDKTVLPSIMMDQMELLELEMRARAIKAMLMTSQQDDANGSGEAGGGASCNSKDDNSKEEKG